MFTRFRGDLVSRPSPIPTEMLARAFKLASFAISGIVAILTILVLTAGSSPNALQNLYLLKASPHLHLGISLSLTTDIQVDTSSLSVPPKLSSSQYLVDLTALTHSDLVGPPQTPSTLGIAALYRVYVFTCCSPTSCTAPLIGPAFDPMHDLRLSTTSLQGPSRSLEEVLSLYKVLSPILAILLILAFVFSLSAPSVMMLDKRVGSAGWVALAMYALAALCLLVACVAGQVGMARLCDELNGEFGEVGLGADRGSLLAPAWAAFPLCLVNTALAFISIKMRKHEKQNEKAAAAADTVQGQNATAPNGGVLKDKGPQMQRGRESWPVSEGYTLRNTLMEELGDGWLRESVLGSMDGSTKYTGDGSRSAASLSGDADAWYVAHHRRKPVRMPEYRQ